MQQAVINAKLMQELFAEVVKKTGKLTNLRHLGNVVAADLITDKPQASF